MQAQNGTLVVRSIFALLAFIIGGAVAWYAYSQTSSWALVLFAFLATLYVGSRVIPDIITDPDKPARVVYFGLPFVIAISALAASYWLWQAWWLAVVIAFAAGFVGQLAANIMFPEIAAEEAEDTATRMGRDYRQEPRPEQPSGYREEPRPAQPSAVDLMQRWTKQKGLK
jgi:hypothetical protein